MTTTRSLLCDAVTAGWISRKRQRLNRVLLILSRRFAEALENFSVCVGRITTPLRRAAEMARVARLSESRWQTTRVEPGGLAFSAEARVRIAGTLPPVAGRTAASGAG